MKTTESVDEYNEAHIALLAKRSRKQDMADKEYIVFCDESDKQGKFYSNFYGGVIVGSSQYERVTYRLVVQKRGLNLFGEVKWEKVTERYLEKYESLVRCFFEEVAAGHVRVRILFRQNARKPTNLTAEDLEMQYFKLYYQFIKHGFGLRFIDPANGPTRLRLYFDQFPDTREKADRFKGFLYALRESREFRKAEICIAREDIAEVRSHDHVLLQCLDIVLGAMAFRLNEKHKIKPEGQRTRGKRTRAKESLYKTILTEIRKIRPGFNIGVSTGTEGDLVQRWGAPYLHWLFEPSESEFDRSLTKHRTRVK